MSPRAPLSIDIRKSRYVQRPCQGMTHMLGNV